MTVNLPTIFKTVRKVASMTGKRELGLEKLGGHSAMCCERMKKEEERGEKPGLFREHIHNIQKATLYHVTPKGKDEGSGQIGKGKSGERAGDADRREPGEKKGEVEHKMSTSAKTVRDGQKRLSTIELRDIRPAVVTGGTVGMCPNEEGTS